MAQRFYIETLGCPKNQVDSDKLTGTLIAPVTRGTHPAIVLVHGSGAENRAYMLPWARFLIRHGIAVLGYDKRGVGGSTGDWTAATYEDLAGDARHNSRGSTMNQAAFFLAFQSPVAWPA